MYLEFKRQTRAGMKQMMLSTLPLYERTERFRIYEHHTLPGLFQTVAYTRAMLEFWFNFLEIKNDIDEAVAAKMARQSVLYEPAKRSPSCLKKRRSIPATVMPRPWLVSLTGSSH